MKRCILLVALASGLPLSGSFSPAEAQKKGKPPKQNFLVRADFADAASQGVRSDPNDLTFDCGGTLYDYIDNKDKCPHEPAEIASYVTISNDTYFLAPRASQDDSPTHFLVLDFDAQNGSCPTLFDRSDCDYVVTVRFFAENAFTAGATSSAVQIWIEEFPEEASYWVTRYKLIYWNPLTRTADPSDPNVVTVGAPGDDFRADLFSISANGKKKTRLGTFVMPFVLTSTKTEEIFE